MIEASVIEPVVNDGDVLDDPDKARNYGKFRFSVLPSPGDRIVVGNNRGSCDVLSVLYVEHHPVRVPTSPLARLDPYVVIHVTFLDSFGD